MLPASFAAKPNRRNPMSTKWYELLPAQAEIRSAAHDQDLIEVPKRALLDREAEARTLSQVVPVTDNQ
jgi:hypothetical protein